MRLLVDGRGTPGPPHRRRAAARDAVGAVSAIAAVPGVREIALTKNGQRLAAFADPLRSAGLHRVNVHIDTLHPERYERLCGGSLDGALRGLSIALACGLRPKLNVVVQRGWNEDEIPRFCEFARELGILVRFIELMDTGVAAELVGTRFFSAKEIAAAVTKLGAIRSGHRGSAPAADYEFSDGTRVGIIGSESEPFCGRCNRLRLSASGTLRTCLYSDSGLNLVEMIQAGRTDAEISAALGVHVAGKVTCHPALVSSQPRFSMAAVGG